MLVPDIYQKDIFSINYDKLKKDGIKCLVFDLDNTLALISDDFVPLKTEILINKLKKNFKVLIISNNNLIRIKPYKDRLKIDAIGNAKKPMTFGLRKIVKLYGFKKKEIIMIGDQLITDILSAKRFKIKSALVDPLGKKDLKITYFNRFLERIIISKYEKKGLLERGKYYE